MRGSTAGKRPELVKVWGVVVANHEGFPPVKPTRLLSNGVYEVSSSMRRIGDRVLFWWHAPDVGKRKKFSADVN